ncbi:hypothetical protein SARC_07596 [Sphaeroforma arctica JP610]|uniref:Uncharacterized protein n=1 Tax=Sphaeroforma arctica JP610 TaxID=667725 RepID=A0A0L0FT95_9EUKA|nr:hypothetical protein SARC_07596 [Sphaeroforma arctica JP610]KNC80030.1 hypothetical protein SARC_07596 [Sphaeroforma arctica JP610]|eukprot:XP_014153932.1 hypothetical protein SARC_07596 [Sphaeroforma arctica JP610]
MEVKYRKKSGKKVRKPKIVDGDESAIKLIARPSKDETVEIIEPLATNQKGVNLSEDDMQLDQVMEDTVECEKLIQEYTGKVDKATHHVRALTERVVAGELNIKKGMDFLHSKLHANLSYCISTAVLMLMKAEGESIKGNDIVKELVRLRGYIEKMRPMESKLKYQIDKLVKMSEQVGGNSEEEANNALSYRPQLSSLVSRDEDSKSLAGRSKGDQVYQKSISSQHR